jgi:hypothetical protein
MATPQRVAYIRTLTEPEKRYEQVYSFLALYIRQKTPEDLVSSPSHRFIFGACNSFDAQILDIFLSDHIVPSKYLRGQFAIQRSDLELHLSSAHAATGAGRRILQRCSIGGIPTTISGTDDDECDAIMLQKSDYVIDRWIESDFESLSWFWNTARSGVPQDTLLTNPKYDMTRHDVSKTRLGRRYAQHGWNANSGCSHGNGGLWRCNGCGGKCKRGMCKIKPSEEEVVPEWTKLPEKGSEKWRDISSDEACWMMSHQRLPGRVTGKDEYCSIDTFSSD